MTELRRVYTKKEAEEVSRAVGRVRRAFARSAQNGTVCDAGVRTEAPANTSTLTNTINNYCDLQDAANDMVILLLRIRKETWDNS